MTFANLYFRHNNNTMLRRLTSSSSSSSSYMAWTTRKNHHHHRCSYQYPLWMTQCTPDTRTSVSDRSSFCNNSFTTPPSCWTRPFSSSSSSGKTPSSPSSSHDKKDDDDDDVPFLADHAAVVDGGEPEVCQDSVQREVAADLFHQYARIRDDRVTSLDVHDVALLLREIGETPTRASLQQLFDVADADGNGVIDLAEFLEHYDYILGGNPARIVLIVGGPGSGKGVLSARLQQKCGVVHLSSGDLLRTEVARDSALGRQVRDIMARGELVSSAIMVALMKRRVRDHPGKRVLLDGFPRSLENAHDLVALCGKPELALHLVCDDTVLLERIIGRGADLPEDERREDDNFQTALQRLRTFHRYHYQTLDWLREQHVPIVNLDCSGTQDSVWQQLKAIGRLMRPAVKLPGEINSLDVNTGSSSSSKKVA